jgi:hypothetical protein
MNRRGEHMTELPLPTRLRNVLARKVRRMTDEQFEQFIDDLESVIRGIEQVQMDTSRERLRRKE